MKNGGVRWLGILCLACQGWASNPALETPWEEQIQTLGYLLMHISSINAIQGIGLSRDQALVLRDLSREVEQVAPLIPCPTRPFRGDLDEVRRVYEDLRKKLLAQEKIEPGMEERIGKARHLENAVIRQSLRTGGSGLSCRDCHQPPEIPDLRTRPDLGAKALNGRSAEFPKTKTDLAHALGILGAKGNLKAAALMDQVWRTLRDEQKELMGSFTCCLIPPQDMRNPERAGQAAGNREIDFLRGVRRIQPEHWGIARWLGERLIEHYILQIKPLITQNELAEKRGQAVALCEKARAMDEMTFELEKGKLGQALFHIAFPKGRSTELDAWGKKFTAATFLLLPGTAKIYEELVRQTPETSKGLDLPSRRPTGK